MKAAIIIPTYNEIENLGILVKKILDLRTKSLIIIVDDNSPDGTGQLADKLARKHKDVYVVHRKKKLGLGTAYIAGFKKAFTLGADVVLTMDADLSHNPKVIPGMLKAIAINDVVIGSRHIKKGKIVGFDLFRTHLSGTAQFVSRQMLGMPIHDSTSGYRAYRKEVIEAIKIEEIRSQGYSFLIEAIYRCYNSGFRIKELPIVFYVRSKGKSKLSQNEIYKALLTTGRIALERLGI